MWKLVLFNVIILAVILLLLWLVKTFVSSEKGQNILLLCAAGLTILCHYSSLIYHILSRDGSAIPYLSDNPNLILPIYPCNLVMWTALVFALIKNKRGRLGAFLGDYLFWFGIFSTFVGMFANVDFIKNPTLADFEVTKSILAHATLLFNVLLLPLFGYSRVDFKRNFLHMLYSVLGMLVVGLYCNLIFHVLVSKEMAYEVNSMFLLHSPFAGLEFLTYPLIALVALLLYALLFALLERRYLPKEKRFFHGLLLKLRRR